MKKFILAALFAAGSITMHAQETDSLDYELRAGEKMGYIITQKGEKVEGIVKLMGNDQTPWTNQKKVKFIAKSDINPDKKSQKFKVMDADDIKEYVAIGDDGTERKFREIKYTNKREAVTNSNGGFGGQIKQIKNFASTTHLAEVIVDGTISVYRLYGYPSPVAIGSNDVAQSEANDQNLRDYPSFVYQKDGSKPKELNVSDVKDLVEDCKLVADKLAAGSYPSYEPAKEEKKKSGLGKLVKNEVDRVGNKLAVMSQEVFGDYDANCGKK